MASNNAAAVPQHPSVSSQAVSAVLEHSLDQDHVSSNALHLPQLIQSIQPPELSGFLPLPTDELSAMQSADPCLSRVLNFKPSRQEPVEAL